MAYIAEWFKVIRDGQFLGVVTDQSFARYSDKSGRLHICKAMDGQYLVLNDRFYRDDWMLPLSPDAKVAYEEATVLSITEKEYDILNKVKVTEPINVEDLYFTDPYEVPEKAPKETEVVTVDFIRKRKLEELSAECRKAIEEGFSLVLSDGAPHHFSMTMQDQLNLMGLQQALADGNDLIYHADNELEQYYSAEDVRLILTGAQKWKSYHVALFNSMKNWINQLNDISVIDAISFDSEIPEEYCTTVLISLTENF